MKQNDFDFEDQKAPGGYISDDHKRKFTITTGILGAFFFIAQFIAPFIIMIAYMPFMVFSGDSWLKVTKPERSALWGDSIWYVESSISTGPSSDHRSMLKQLNIYGEDGPKDVGILFTESPWLLPGMNRLWIISSSAVGYFQDGEVVLVSEKKTLGDISRPFLYKGMPAVIEESPIGLTLMVLKDGSWEKESSISLDIQKERCCIQKNLQVLCEWDSVHVFLKYGNGYRGIVIP